jgi:acyl-CoA thioesterase
MTVVDGADFARDTAVTAAGEGRWHATVSPLWAIATGGANGGYVGAIVLHAMEAAVGDATRRPRSLTLHLLRACGPGAVEISVTVERTGRTLTSVSARLTQEDRLIVLALGAFGRTIDDVPAVLRYAEPPPVPTAPPDLRMTEAWPEAPPIAHRLALTSAFGPGDLSGGDEAVTGGWMRLAEPSPPDAAALLFYADAWAPAPWARVTEPTLAPTIDLTVHFRAALPHPGMTAQDPVLGRFVSTTSRDGYFEEDGAVWAPDGTLLVQSRQLALLPSS